MPQHSQQRVTVVTGAEGGIGGAIARRLLASGDTVIGVDCELGTQASGFAAAFTVDVTDGVQVASLFAEVERRFGRLDGLVNVVGASGRRMGDGPVDLCTEEGWDWVLDVNLRSVFLCCKHAIPVMRRSGGGSIVNMGSVLGLVGHELFDTHAYAASKGAVTALSRAMAVKYAPERIRVNVVCPGLIRTPMSLRAQGSAEVLTALEELQPLTGGFGEPEDVAEAVAYLVSDASRFVTGVVLPVDGGWTAR